MMVTCDGDKAYARRYGGGTCIHVDDMPVMKCMRSHSHHTGVEAYAGGLGVGSNLYTSSMNSASA